MLMDQCESNTKEECYILTVAEKQMLAKVLPPFVLTKFVSLVIFLSLEWQ